MNDAATFRELLATDHMRLNRMLSTILTLTRNDDQPSLKEYWAAYEDSVPARFVSGTHDAIRVLAPRNSQ